MQLVGGQGANYRDAVSRVGAVREIVPAPRAYFALRSLSRTLWIGERIIKLTPLEVMFVNLLRRRGGRVLARDAACAALWGARGESYEKRLDLLVKRLRDKLGADHDLVRTVAGCGHRLCLSGLLRNEKIVPLAAGFGTHGNRVTNRTKM